MEDKSELSKVFNRPSDETINELSTAIAKSQFEVIEYSHAAAELARCVLKILAYSGFRF